MQGLFCLLVILAPLFTGLYYEKEFLPFGMLFSLMLLCMLFFLQKGGLSFDKYDLLGAGVCLVYLLSLWNAADLRLAYFGFVKYSVFFAVFYLVRRLFTEQLERQYLSNVVVFAVTISAVIGLIQKIIYLQPRLTGTYTYVNSFAMLLAVAIIILLSSYATCQKRLIKLAYGFSAYLCLVSLFSTGSRGAILVYVVALLCLLIISRQRWEIIKTLIISHLFSLVGVLILAKASGWLFFFLFTLIGLLGAYVLLICTEKVKLKKILWVIVPLALLGFLYYVTREPLQLFYPFSRLTRFNIFDIARIVFYQDALKLFTQNWLVGSGSNSWTLLYYQVQTYPYIAKEVHSSIFSLLLEVGTIGIIMVFTFVGAILYNFISRMRKKEVRETEKGLWVVAMAMLLHSTIDFDLAFSSFVMYLFMLLGLLIQQPQTQSTKKEVRVFAYSWFILIFISCSSFLIANAVEKTALADVANGRLAVSQFANYKRDLHTAIILDPLNSKYRLYLGQVMLAEGNQKKDQALLDTGLEEITKAISLAPRDYRNYIVYGNLLFQLGQYEEGAETYRAVIELCPFKGIGYYHLSRTYVQMCLERTDLSFAERAIEVYKQAHAQVQSVEEKYLKISAKQNIPDLDPYLNYQIGIAYALKGDYPQSLEHFKLAEKKTMSNYHEVVAWKTVIAEKLKQKVNTEADEKLLESIRKTLQMFNHV